MNNMGEQNKNNLSGMKEIAAYVRRSEDTALKMIRVEGLPASKILGVWVSSKDLLDAWIRDKAASGPKSRQAEKRPAKTQRRQANP